MNYFTADFDFLWFFRVHCAMFVLFMNFLYKLWMFILFSYNSHLNNWLMDQYRYSKYIYGFIITWKKLLCCCWLKFVLKNDVGVNLVPFHYSYSGVEPVSSYIYLCFFPQNTVKDYTDFELLPFFLFRDMVLLNHNMWTPFLSLNLPVVKFMKSVRCISIFLGYPLISIKPIILVENFHNWNSMKYACLRTTTLHLEI